MRKIIKNLLYILFYFLDYFFFEKKRVLVLMYHSVGENKVNWRCDLKLSEFEKQIKYLKQNFKIVRINDIVNYIKLKKNLIGKNIAITFDDGYLNTYTEVFPIIKKYNIPITVFLTTNLEKQKKLGFISRPSWNHVKEMYDSGLVNFEVHGHNHKNWKKVYNDLKELGDDILTCRAIIKKKLLYQSNFVSYPFGKKNNEIISYLKRNYFEAGFSISEGQVESGDDPFQIKRIEVDDTVNFLLFRMKLTRALDMYNKFISFIKKYKFYNNKK